MHISRKHVVGTTVALMAISPFTAPALASPPAGVTSTTLATADLAHRVRASSDHIALRTKAPTTVRMQNLVLAAGSHTGWHHHPGFVLVAVQSGMVTVQDASCHAVTYGPGSTAGSAFVESGDGPIEVTSEHGASVYATYVVPTVEPVAFRTESDPVSCP